MIKLFATDVDGTMTDACMYYAENNIELKKFNFRDGMGFQLLREAGIKTAIITSEKTQIVKKRAAKLNVDYLSMGTWKKLDFIKHICKELNITLEDVAYIGDDINDIELLTSVKYKACPKDAVDKVKNIPNIQILNSKGGDGAVREFIESLLNAEIIKDELNKIINRPWGYYICQNRGSNYQSKIISVNPQQQLSLQSHQFRDEHWVVLEGKATIIKNSSKYILNIGESIDIPKRIKHSLINDTNEELKILEVQIGKNLSEEDIVRYEDKYGRV